MMKLPTYTRAPLLAIFAATYSSAQVSPVVTCEQDIYALCAYAKCTMNDDMKTANCPCYSLSGPSLARVDIIPDADVKQATMDECTDATPCTQNNAPICEAIADGTLWPGADAVSTFSRELEVENGVIVDEDGERGAPSWTCSAPEGGRLVPNCMLAPCRSLDTPVTESYFDGEVTMECTCPLIRADMDYAISGGLEDPCDSETFVNTGGAVLVNHAKDTAAVASAWEAVDEEFRRLGVSNDVAAVKDDITAKADGSSGSSMSMGAIRYMTATAMVMMFNFLL